MRLFCLLSALCLLGCASQTAYVPPKTCARVAGLHAEDGTVVAVLSEAPPAPSCSPMPPPANDCAAAGRVASVQPNALFSPGDELTGLGYAVLVCQAPALLSEQDAFRL